jgi:hypothetical protein
MMADDLAHGQGPVLVRLPYRIGVMEGRTRTQRGSVGAWVGAHLRWLVFWLAAIVVLAIVVSLAWPETATASSLVVMTAAAIVGLVFSALWTEELLRALRDRDGIALFFILFEIGKIAIVFGGSLLFLFAVLFTLDLGT